MVAKLGDSASENGQKNVAFLSYFVLGKLEDCLETLISTNRQVGFGLGTDDNFNGDLHDDSDDDPDGDDDFGDEFR